MTVAVGFEVIPQVLQEHGKAANPWPNVDAGSGALLHHFGITEMRYYTVLFSVSRAMGICSQLVLSRAVMEPITRPKSVSTAWLKEQVASKMAEAEGATADWGGALGPPHGGRRSRAPPPRSAFIRPRELPGGRRRPWLR
jgi:hypothetical protein